jgi:hypothetical protein
MRTFLIILAWVLFAGIVYLAITAAYSAYRVWAD